MAATQTIPAVGQGSSAPGASGTGLPSAGVAGVSAPDAAKAASSAVGGSAPTAQHATSTAMVPVEPETADQFKQDIDQERLAFSPAVVRLPVELDVIVPVRNFRVRNLLALEPGQVIESQWLHGDDVPIAAGETTLAWSEFEVIDNQIAVRITRLS